jgi:YggT family protein
MTPTQSFFAHWYFHVPNLIMASLIYTLIGRYLLEIVFAKRQDVVILRVFRTVTDPITSLVRFITPRIVPDGLIIVFAIAWLMAGRMFWYLTCVAAGMRINLGG